MGRYSDFFNSLDEAFQLLAASLKKFEEAEVHLHDLVVSGDFGLASLVQDVEDVKYLIERLGNVSNSSFTKGVYKWRWTVEQR
jgi:hypothetical protein